MFVTKALRFAEPNAVNDAGVIQFVTNHSIFVGKQRFKESAIGVEAGGIKDRAFGPEEFCECGFELRVNVLRAADKTHARHAEPVRVERFFGGGDECRMIGETEVIVCAHVEHAFAASDRNVRSLRTGDDPLSFEKTLRFNFIECLRNLFFEFGDHIAPQITQISQSKKREQKWFPKS